MITYHKLPTGEWVAQGPASELKLGPVKIHKRSGGICDRVVDEIIPATGGKVYGYLTEHCKPQSQIAADARKRSKETAPIQQ